MEEIYRRIPHRPPFLFIDQILEITNEGHVITTGTFQTTAGNFAIENDEDDTNPLRVIRRVTQSEYDALTPATNTLYIIV